MTYDQPPTDAAPMAQHQAEQLDQLHQLDPIKGKKRGSGTPQPRDTRPSRWPLIVGAIIILDDGSACQVVALWPEPLCVPVPAPTP